MANSIEITDTRKKDITLNYITYIYQSVYFQKSNNNIEALINFDREINTKDLIYASKLDFQIRKFDIEAYNIYRSSF